MTAQTTPLPCIYVAGLGLATNADDVAPEVGRLAENAAVLIGGKRQLALFASHKGKRIEIGANPADAYARMAENREKGLLQLALCSGDPLFYGLGARLAEKLGPEAVRIIPATSSLQAAAAFLGMPQERMRTVSLHGRKDWLPLAHALIAGGPVFLLTDDQSSPGALAAWMSERGRWRYAMHVMEDLHQTADGQIHAGAYARLGLAQASSWRPAQNGAAGRVILLEPDTSLLSNAAGQPWPFGLSDAEVLKENRLLTKAPVRAAALAALTIEQHHIVWDLGAGSGAVSVEAARLAWQGRVYAVERTESRVELLKQNRKRYGAANMEILAAAMPDCLPALAADEAEWNGLEAPDRIFIGGGLGGAYDNARETLHRAWNALRPGGVLLADCVLLSSLERARGILAGLGANTSVTCVQASTSGPLAGDLRLEALNPVFLVRAEKTALGAAIHDLPHELSSKTALL